MSLYIEEEGQTVLPVDTVKIAQLVVNAVLELEGCPYEAEVSLLLTTDTEVKKLNQEFRHIDKTTDVLSFPMLEFIQPGDFTDLDESRGDLFDPETGELVLGDIVLSKEKVLAQSETYGHSVEREYAFLIAHSMLHLCGYDHIEEKDRQTMEKKQDEIMKKIQILR